MKNKLLFVLFYPMILHGRWAVKRAVKRHAARVNAQYNQEKN